MIYEGSLLFSTLSSLETEIFTISQLVSEIENELHKKNEELITNEYKIDLNTIRKFEIINDNKFKKLVFKANLEEIEKLNNINKINNKIYDKTLLLLNDFLKIKDELIYLKEKISEEQNLDYIERFKEDTDFILKKYEVQVNNLTTKLQTRINNLNLKQTELEKNSSLLNTGLEAGLKSLSSLNEKNNNIEMEFSKLLDTESKKIKDKLNTEDTRFKGVVDNLIKEVTKKTEEIYTNHQDFKNLVEKAGIYELTQNYKTKANDEKKDYKLNMWLTVTAITLAVIATIIIITIPIVEHWKVSPPVNMDYFTLFARLSISLMFFVLALYTSKQAAKHYECYQENHRTFLQLAALEPFMARMNEEEQKEIRKGLIPSYFNQASEGKYASKSDEVGLPESFKSSIDKLADVVKEITVSQKSNKPSENE